MIERLTGFPDHVLPDNVLAFVCKGRVTKADYEGVLIPAVTKALETYDKLDLYYEIAADFEGFDPGAMWADAKVGLAHLSRWRKIAVVTDVDWIGHAVAMFGFMMPAEVKVFPLAEAAKARAWIGQAA
ncbi:MAG: STAS/SEC14 domain-containing protein [Rhodopseudomonas sp.]|nr:STAS/SEC14 domain-containing protein [Rhodopseudomonas sp.]